MSERVLTSRCRNVGVREKRGERERSNFLQPRVDFIKLGAERKALRPIFEKLFTGVKVGRRPREQMDTAISMICAQVLTFMKSTLGRFHKLYLRPTPLQKS